MSPSLLQSTLFLLIPLFSIALTVLACSHSPGPLKPQAILAYFYIASVTLLSTLAGALPLSHSSNSISESLIQALLFLFIGIPVLHLAPTYVPHLSIRRLHTSVLVITLSIATLFALISPFLPTATPLLCISPSLSLLYTIQSIPSIAYILNNFLYPEDPTQSNPTISLTLPSPASTASFSEKHHRKIPSVSTTSTITIVDRTRITFPPQDHLHSQILNSRSRSLLVFILAVQVASLAANACALGVAISDSYNPTTLKTIQTACTVLALTGSMSAYLLHIYNLHLRKTPSSNSNYNNLSRARSDSIAVGLRLVSSPACTPVPAALPVPLPLRVDVEEGSGFSTLEKRKKEKIQEYYLSSSSSPSTASSSSPSSPFERCGTETDLSSPETPYSSVACNDGAVSTNINMPVAANTLLRKRSSFFGWEFAWDQEALERADYAGKLKSAVGSGGSPVRWKSDINPSSSKEIQPPFIVDQESFITDLDEDVDADAEEDVDLHLQKTPTMKSRTLIRSYSHSPPSHRQTAVSSPPVRSTITEQHQQDENNSVFSAAAREPHPFMDWIRSLEKSTSRDEADVEQEMKIIRRGNDDDERLSSLPLLPPLPPLLLPSMRPPSQSQSLPPTPTKSQSTLLGKPSMSSFKKRSAPPALPSLTMPKPSLRLSAMKMGTVRNAFAGVGAKVSARMSINSASTTRSSAGAPASNTTVAPRGVGMGMDDIDGDFMDLRDPFASPPPSNLVNAWGRLAIPSTLPLPAETSNGGISLEIANRKKAHSYHGERRKHKKEKPDRKVADTTAGVVLVETNCYGLSAPCSAGEEDADFGVEEALLSQRLLKRLDSDSFEWE